MKFLFESSLLVILMTMEMVSLIMMFIVLHSNPAVFSLSACIITLLSVLVSESVLGLSIFINLMRFSSSEKVSSFLLN